MPKGHVIDQAQGSCSRCGCHVMAEAFEKPCPESELVRRTRALGDTLEDLRLRALRLVEKHRPFNSAHEVYGVLLEEMAELFEEVRKKEHLRSRLAMRAELLDIAAAALRAASEIPPPGAPTPVLKADPCE